MYVSTTLEVCEARDVKGLYKKARAGIIKGKSGLEVGGGGEPKLLLDSKIWYKTGLKGVKALSNRPACFVFEKGKGTNAFSPC